ncbi:diguanylate cyclase [Dethiosulfovibrio sp. F2B]|uniref:GGDEF domain-containing protein n=1 Tax=Dethiosulfovibrio faecalis TaxID=2720018 RepID=UPI001F4342D2|nr:sensor domain-containing diguanylate cyclase [Dethiosulfovibrio faecalis]MCF4152340.1 diguanylate cyclase [Dethiosulfovibrio faecalis]
MKRDEILNLRTTLKRGLVFLALIVLAYVAVSLYDAKVEVMREADRQLELAALALPSMLAPDFHDRATTPYAISKEEELRNRRVFGDYVSRTGFAWVYTLIEDGGRFFFSAPTVTEEEAAERARWYYYPYPEAPVEFQRAYESEKPVWVTYTDRWGTYRSIAYPMRSEEGRKYLACADMDVGFMWHSIFRRGLTSLAVSAFFVLMSLPFLLAYRRYSNALAEKVAELEEKGSDLEVRLIDKTGRLDEAMERIADLSVTDSLTGLYDRSHGMATLDRMCDSGGWLFLLDLDDFSRINDVLGHQGGDEVLARIGETIKDSLKEGEFAARRGGDEFLVLVSPMSEHDASDRAEELRKSLVALGHRYGWPISVSMGTARITRGASPRLLLNEAESKIDGGRRFRP